MMAILSVQITKCGYYECVASKEIDICFAPFVGLQVSDTVWKKEATILNVIYSHAEQSFDISFDVKESTENENELSSIKKMYESHGWVIDG